MRWFLYLPFNLLMGLAVLPLAPLAVLLFSTDDKHHLKHLKWLETIDNDLTGDDGWRNEHLIGTNPLSWLNRTRWLWRNGGNSVNYNLLGCADIDCIQYSSTFWKNSEGYWQLRRRFYITKLRFVDVYLGWGLTGPKLGRCKFVCTIRLKKNA